MIGAIPRRPSRFDQVTTELNAVSSTALDPSRMAGGLPGGGKKQFPHVLTFNSLLGSIARVYRDNDEAIKASRDNARFMRNDPGIMECLEARQRLTALLDWHLEPEDENSAEQRELCSKLTMLLRRIRRFQEYRRNLLEAIWYGKYAIQHTWNRQQIQGKSYILPTATKKVEGYGWSPINGDKLVFQHDDTSWLSSFEKTKHIGPVGILINRALALTAGIEQENIVPTDRGMAYFPPIYKRELLAIHRHQIEDAPWESPIDAGAIHGVGVRSRIYWEWFQEKESLAYMLEYLERSAAGIEIWEYPIGNPEAKAAVEDAANQRGSGNKGVILFPKPLGEDAALFNMHVVEPGMGGIEVIKDLLTNYFGHRIKRYILGQTLTSEADATGLGSGLADLHLDTLMQIVKYDARNLEETLTYELVKPLQRFNFPASSDIHVRFVIETEGSNADEKLSGFKQAWEMGARIKESDVLDAIGASAPESTDVVLRNQAAGQPPQAPDMLGQDAGHASDAVDPRLIQQHAADMAMKIKGAMGPEGDGTELEQYSRPGDPQRGAPFDVTSSAISSRLTTIAQDFIDTLAIDPDSVVDIVVTGSAANPQRFGPASDIDVHLVVDAEATDVDREFLDEYLYDHAALWNLKHDIRIGGHPVELFVEFSGQPAVSGGRYSLIGSEWIDEPTDDDDDDDLNGNAAVVDQKADCAERRIELAIQRQDHNQLNRLLERLQRNRREGLDTEGEASIENEVYRELRHRGTLDQLRQAILDTYDAANSLEFTDTPEHYTRDVAQAAREAAAVTDTRPTDAQKISGNYRKGRFWCHGFEVTIETPRGAKRSGKAKDDTEWSVRMPCHYGYMRRTEGNDGDQLDVFIGPDPACDLVYVVDQVKQDSGKFDEHKIMVGFHTEAEARKAYSDAFAPGWKIGTVTPATWRQLVRWIETGDVSTPYARASE